MSLRVVRDRRWMRAIVRARPSLASHGSTDARSGGSWFFRLASSQRRGEARVGHALQIRPPRFPERSAQVSRPRRFFDLRSPLGGYLGFRVEPSEPQGGIGRFVFLIATRMKVRSSSRRARTDAGIPPGPPG
jgi:hypothetical protein